MFNSFDIWEMQINTTLKVCLVPVRMVIISKTIKTNSDDVVEKEPLFSTGGNVN
jgi:hypothetical protein